MRISMKFDGLTKKHYKELYEDVIKTEFEDIIDASVYMSGNDIVINTDNLNKKELDYLGSKLHKTIDRVLSYAKDKRYEDTIISPSKIITVYNNAYKRRQETNNEVAPIIEYNSAVNGISGTIIYSLGYANSLADNDIKVEICTTVKDFLLKAKSGLHPDMIADRDYAMQVLASARILIHNSYYYAVDIYDILIGVAALISSTTVFDYEFVYVTTINDGTDIYYMRRKE